MLLWKEEKALFSSPIAYAIVAVYLLVMGFVFTLMLFINRTAEPDALVACEGEPHLSASLFFYLSRQVVWAGTPTGSVVSAERHHIASGPFIRDEELVRDWHSRRQVFFILEESNLPEWRRKLAMREGDGVIVARDGTRIVLVNHWNFALPVVSAVKCFCRPGGR